MRYFKIIKDREFIGIITSLDFVRYLKKHDMLITADVALGEAVDYRGQLYHDVWMLPPVNRPYIQAEIEEISKEEYQEFYDAILHDIPIDIAPPPIEPIPEPEQEPSVTVEYAKLLKIRALLQQCEQAIYSGFDYNDKHYSLTTTDQINLLSALNLILAGAESAFYHADGEMIQAYNAAEITALAQHMNTHIADCINTFQVLREHVNELEEVKEILAVEWSDAYGE